MDRRLHYLLLQMRNAGDPMAAQEIRCFARALECDATAIDAFNLLSGAPRRAKLSASDVVLLGGSGHYSAATEPGNSGTPPWLDRAFDCLREIHRLSRPTFASCWGFQAMARALGGECIHDLANAELGTIDLMLTDAGHADPVFGGLPATFRAQAGHEDHVVKLPADAVLLASSNSVREQAFRFVDKPIYCTQFHPELDRAAMLERVVAYPEYVERIAQVTYDEFVLRVRDTPESKSLLRRFVAHLSS
jgi:GMP synthase (glutamine-hydrolysing)